MRKKNKLLFICPNLNLPGGIAGYYKSLRHHFSCDVDFFYIGAKKQREKKILKPYNLLRDIVRLFIYLLTSKKKYDLVCLNPSFIPFCILREGLLLRVINFFNAKAVVFFRGWSWDFSKTIENKYFKFFFWAYDKATAFIVLSQEFENQIKKWGFKQPIFIETTVVDKKLLDGYSFENRASRILSGSKTKNILFLSRVEKEKGIIETIETLSIISKSHPEIRLLVAGVGGYLSKSVAHCKQLDLERNIDFLGWVSGKQKSLILSNSDILMLPTYREGMPNCVLEAMAFGIPTVTRPIGGLNDFFKDGEFGFMTDSTDPEMFAFLIEKIMADTAFYWHLSETSFKYAAKHFLSDRVAKRIEKICEQIMLSS